MKLSKTLFLAVTVLTGTSAFASLPDASQAWLDKNSKTITKLYVAGGTASIDDATVTAAAAAESPVKVESFTGTIKITKKDGTVVTVVSDGKTAPPALTDGDQVTVVSGDAKLSVGGTTATLKAGDTVGVSGRSMNVVTGNVPFTNSKGTTIAKPGDIVTVPAPASVPSNTAGKDPFGNDLTKTDTKGSNEQEQQNSASPSAP